jgi:isopropylmalate/homocitrate/citramalate synthase
MTAVRIVEVGPRDGLQNEKQVIPTDTKLELIARLADAGLRDIEVSPSSASSHSWPPRSARACACVAMCRAWWAAPQQAHLSGARFTAADVSVGYALMLAQHLGSHPGSLPR